MYDVTVPHFESKKEDDLREVGMTIEHRVDPQIQVGLLVDPEGFPLVMHMFPGNKDETTPSFRWSKRFRNATVLPTWWLSLTPAYSPPRI